jgi:hypothetical protein
MIQISTGILGLVTGIAALMIGALTGNLAKAGTTKDSQGVELT